MTEGQAQATVTTHVLHVKSERCFHGRNGDNTKWQKRPISGQTSLLKKSLIYSIQLDICVKLRHNQHMSCLVMAKDLFF